MTIDFYVNMRDKHEFETVFPAIPNQPTKARDTQEGGNHYKDKAMQPWDIIDAWELDFYAGNVVKYILRYRFKDGVNDLKKARHYIDKLIEDYEDAT